MAIEIKKSVKPVDYNEALDFMEERLKKINDGFEDDLIWILEHKEIYTGGTSYKKEEILDKSINFIETNRGGKVTYHGPGHLIFYFVIDLKKREKNIRKVIDTIEKTIINSLKEYNIETFADRKNIGIWYKNLNSIEKVAAIGIKVKKWIAYHGFALNISNNLNAYKKIIPCGLNNEKIISLNKIKKQNYKLIDKKLIKNFIKYLNN